MRNVDSYNLYLFKEGKLNRAYDIFGAHLNKNENGQIISTTFRVYAPNAKIVSVIGDFNNWDSRVSILKEVGDSKIFELTIDKNLEWEKYRYVFLTHSNNTIFKSDPYAFFTEIRPETCSRVYDIDGYNWNDKEYLDKRRKSEHLHEPLSIYEMNIGSWMMKPDGTFNKYNELTSLLIPYLKKIGFNAVEFMPLIEYPLDESWGYQGTGYYSITSRYGAAKDLMYLIDSLHKENIKVIMDWVPGHICKDSTGLYNFDGTHLYEYDDEFRRENTVWGTANLDFSKGHTSSFLLSNAMFFMEYFHIDGFRLDAVSNIYYYLGNENNGISNEGIDFLKTLTKMIKDYDKNVIVSAEDSTTYKDVTKKVEYGGIGFDYKWNMGWMNDNLKYFSKDPIYRKYHHNLVTFSMIYNYSENFILPLSHDEVVHGKGSLIGKMPGDYWQKFSNYRALIGFMFTHPGKKLLFMGGEFAQFSEWNELRELDWFLLQYEKHKKAQTFVSFINDLYKKHKSLYLKDDDPSSFKWIDANNKDQSVLIYKREVEDDCLIVILNLTPESYLNYRVGVPYSGKYIEILNSDKEEFGGSNLYNGLPLQSENISMHNLDNSISLTLSPLSITILEYRKE